MSNVSEVSSGRAVPSFPMICSAVWRFLPIDLLLTRSEAKSEDTCRTDLRGAGHPDELYSPCSPECVIVATVIGHP